MADFAHGIYVIFAALQGQHPWGTPKQIPRNTCCWHEGVAELRHVGTMDPQWNGLPSRNTVVRASEWRRRKHQESIKAVNWWRSKWQTFHCHKAQLRKLNTIPIFLVSFLKLQQLFLEQKFNPNLILHILKSRNSTPPSSSWWVPVSSSVESVGVAVYASNWHTDLRWPCHSGWSSGRWPATPGMPMVHCKRLSQSFPSDVPMRQMRHRNKVIMQKYVFWSFVVKNRPWSENTSDWLCNEVVAGSSLQKKTVPRWDDQTSKRQTVDRNRPSSHPLTHRCMFSRSTPQNVSSEIYQVWTWEVCLPDPLCGTSPIVH